MGDDIEETIDNDNDHKGGDSSSPKPHYCLLVRNGRNLHITANQVLGMGSGGQSQSSIPSKEWMAICRDLSYLGPTKPDPELLMGPHPELEIPKRDLFAMTNSPPFSNPDGAYLDGTVNNVPPNFWGTNFGTSSVILPSA